MFREDKTTQMAARFLQMSNGRMSSRKLLKLLYLADKQMLIRYGKPITYDRWFALRYGPVLGSTYHLIQSDAPSGYWSNYLKTDNHDVILCDDPGSDALSIAEDRIIEAVFDEFNCHDKWQCVEAAPSLPEWEDASDAANEITYEAVLRMEGLDKEDIENILQNIRVQHDSALVLGTL